jgi:hypothetical protein
MVNNTGIIVVFKIIHDTCKIINKIQIKNAFDIGILALGEI